MKVEHHAINTIGKEIEIGKQYLYSEYNVPYSSTLVYCAIVTIKNVVIDQIGVKLDVCPQKLIKSSSPELNEFMASQRHEGSFDMWNLSELNTDIDLDDFDLYYFAPTIIVNTEQRHLYPYLQPEITEGREFTPELLTIFNKYSELLQNFEIKDKTLKELTNNAVLQCLKLLIQAIIENNPALIKKYKIWFSYALVKSIVIIDEWFGRWLEKYRYDYEKPISDFISRLKWLVLNKFEIIGKSIKEKSKHKNGDFFDYTILENDIVVLTLADGVGSKNCDWLASQTACERFINYSSWYLNKDYSENTLLKACYDIDKGISLTSDDCKGMLAVFAAVIWDTEKNFIHFVNIGDTRIYKINNGSIIQISSDETKDVIVRDNQGNIITSNGIIMYNSGVTNALGTGYVRVNVETTDFNCGDTIVLASDGFYNCKATFNSDVQNLINSTELEKSLEKLFLSYSDYQIDDTTVLILRRNDIDPETKNKFCTINDFENVKHKIAHHTLTVLLYDDLKLNINQKNKENCIAILDKMKTNNHLPTREQLDELLVTCKMIDFKDKDIYSRIVNLIRILMKVIY